jgi:aminoglycoside 6'-N-acetyltransferase
LSGLRLVPIAAEHRERLEEMRQQPGVLRWWQEPEPGWLDDEAEMTKRSVLLDRELIGYAQWYEESDPMYRHAAVDLFLDPAFHGRGVGTQVVRMICAHLIDERGHHRLTIDPEADNEVAIACYRKAGFREVGVLREYQRDRFGVWKDGLLMELLAAELVRG